MPVSSQFELPGGKAHFAALPYKEPGDAVDDDFELILVTGRRLEHYNAGTMTRRTGNADLMTGDVLEIHPDDAAPRGLDDGGIATVTSRVGEIKLPVQVTDRIEPGHVFTTFHFPEVRTNLLVGQSAVLLAAIAAMAVATAGMLVLEVVATTIFQREVPDAIRGRTIGAMDTVTVSAYALGAFLAPVLASIISPVAVLLGFGIAMVTASIVGTLIVGRSSAPALDPGAERFVRLPIFEGLSPASLEQAAGHLSRVRTTPGEVIVRQGDPADRFFHILDGSFEVTQVKDPGGAPRFLQTLGPDEVFGEIGILSGVPRTATVTANGDGALLALDGQRFLDLVGSGPGLSSRLLDVHRGTGARLEVARDDG